MLRRCLSTATPRRVLCSLEELKAREGGAVKFPLSESSPKPTGRVSRGGSTGFVFYCEHSQAPRAFVNSCPHALLELDLDDADFFCDGFIQCKAHGAFFDPQTGICLQGPAAARRGRLEKQLGALTELSVHVEDGLVVVDPQPSVKKPTSRSDQEWRDYRAKRQHDLTAVMETRIDDVKRIQEDLHAKTMARMRRYAASSPEKSRAERKGDEGAREK